MIYTNNYDLPFSQNNNQNNNQNNINPNIIINNNQQHFKKINVVNKNNPSIRHNHILRYNATVQNFDNYLSNDIQNNKFISSNNLITPNKIHYNNSNSNLYNNSNNLKTCESYKVLNNNFVSNNYNNNINNNINNNNNIISLPNKINNNNIISRNNVLKQINVPKQKFNLSFDAHNNKIKKNSTIIIIQEPNRPRYFNIFKSLNIFNSLLISLNNISFVMDYFSKQKHQNNIRNCEMANPNGLTTILYHIYKLLWHSYYNSEKELIIKYNNFINYRPEVNSNCNYFSEINNIPSIISLIFGTINTELSQEKANSINLKFNNLHKNFGVGILPQFKNQFSQKNKSVISDNFLGVFKNKTELNCRNCKINNFSNQNSNNAHSYSEFYYINFDLNKIREYYSMNENKQNINLDNCFDYTFINEKKCIYSKCNICFQFTNKFETKSIFSLPNILSIVLSNNLNDNFILQEKLKLKKYCKNIKDNGEYYLISLICRVGNNGPFVIYCFNPKEGYWYYYSINKIERVKEISINEIPLILFYQKGSSIPNEYHGIKQAKKDPNDIKLQIKVNQGYPMMELYFNKFIKIKKMKQKISCIINQDINKFYLMINATKAGDEQILKDLLNGFQNNILVFINI